MTSLAAHERSMLCATALQSGPDAPTLCGDWDVRDLMVHLVVREGHPVASAGIFARPLAGVRRKVERSLREEDFVDLVTRVRNGPPLWSPFAVPKLGGIANIAEYFVHHEDIRRAAPGWAPRTQTRSAEDTLWRLLCVLGRATSMKAPTGIVLRRSDVEGSVHRLRKAPDGLRDVEVTGPPSELLLFAYGRQEQCEVELDGDPSDVDALHNASLGI